MERRSFIKLVAGALHTLVGAVVAAPVLRFLAYPLAAGKRERGFLRAVPADTTFGEHPLRVTLSADRWDAFHHHPPGPIGGVWLSKSADDGAPRCLQTICPHLGCGIEYAADRKAFFCPCHASEFDPDGRRRFGPSPRDMDELPCRISEPDEQGLRWVEVQYGEFKTGVPTKQPTA